MQAQGLMSSSRPGQGERPRPCCSSFQVRLLLPGVAMRRGIDGAGRRSSPQFRRLSRFFDCWTMDVSPEDRRALASQAVNAWGLSQVVCKISSTSSRPSLNPTSK